MRLSYSAHARMRMAERRITEDDVEAVVAHPYRVIHSRRRANPIYIGRVAGREIGVVIAAGSVPPRVITVWST